MSKEVIKKCISLLVSIMIRIHPIEKNLKIINYNSNVNIIIIMIIINPCFLPGR